MIDSRDLREPVGLREQVGKIDGLVQKLESAADPASRAAAKELVQALMDLHGGALERILEIVSKAGESSERILKALGSDELVSSLLVLYELHPDDFETRVRRGLEKAEKIVRSRGASIEDVEIGQGTVHLRFALGGHACGSTARDVEAQIREALLETAPDAASVVIDVPGEPATNSFVPLANLQPIQASGHGDAANGST